MIGHNNWNLKSRLHATGRARAQANRVGVDLYSGRSCFYLYSFAYLRLIPPFIPDHHEVTEDQVLVLELRSKRKKKKKKKVGAQY